MVVIVTIEGINLFLSVEDAASTFA